MATEIVIPRSLPIPRYRPHSFSPLDIARTGEADQGELRRRPIYRSVPQQLRLEWVVDQSDLDTFWDWFEGTLAAGAKKFDVKVAKQGTEGLARGARLTWYTAQFVGMPQHEAKHRGFYAISATLLLMGAPFDIRIPPGILASGGIRFRGRAITAAVPVRAAGGIAFRGGWVVQSARVVAQGGIAFGGAWRTGIVSTSAIAREDSGRILREDGTRIERE
jgi:hypothetical protein